MTYDSWLLTYDSWLVTYDSWLLIYASSLTIYDYRVNKMFVALKEIRLQEEEGAPFTAIREGKHTICTNAALLISKPLFGRNMLI